MRDIIKAESLTKDYGSGRGVFDLSFSVRQGEVFGLVGTNGSGKTTTLRQLMGFIRPDSGSCSIFDSDCTRSSGSFMSRVGYVPGEIDFPDMGSGTSFLKLRAEYLGIKDSRYIGELVDMFRLDSDAPLKRMSKGMKQKTALVAAFMSRPDVLLLDEPSTGLDPLMRDTLTELILKEKKRGAAVLMSSHIFKELDDTADRVLFIEDGKKLDLIETGTLTAGLPKAYRVGFKSGRDIDRFLLTTKMAVTHTNRDALHIDISVQENGLEQLFGELSGFDIRYLRERPFTLEGYYTDVIEKGGKRSA
ncbi:MAG: ATP-binding cassette domain-containing protein [Ruminococcus sp.]|nr:ATP-binding cassette domain-containing protein [Ruminococcus sp.]